MKTHTITLTHRQITLIRVALLQRLSRLMQNMEGRNPLHAGDAEALKILSASYAETRAMLFDTGELSLASLKEAPPAHEIGSTVDRMRPAVAAKIADLRAKLED